DFYREVIETPLSLPDDIKAKLNLESRGRGRIWRIATDDGKKHARPTLGKALSAELVAQLEQPNIWWRLTAQRLLVERQDKSVDFLLQKMAKKATFAPARAHALWTLHGLGLLSKDDVLDGLKDPSPGVREQALRLAEGFAGSARILRAVLPLVNDESPRVRFQLAFFLGESDEPQYMQALAKRVVRDLNDVWMQTAVLSSCRKSAHRLLTEIIRMDTMPEGTVALLDRLAMLVGAGGDEPIADVLRAFADPRQNGERWLTVLDGLNKGLKSKGRSLATLLKRPPAGLADAAVRIHGIVEEAAKTARGGTDLRQRLAAIRVLQYAEYAVAAHVLGPLLTAQEPRDIQSAAVRTLASFNESFVGYFLLSSWSGYSPEIRREVLDAVFARKDRVVA